MIKKLLMNFKIDSSEFQNLFLFLISRIKNIIMISKLLSNFKINYNNILYNFKTYFNEE